MAQVMSVSQAESTSLYRSWGPWSSANLHPFSMHSLHACSMLAPATRREREGDDDGRETEVPHRLDFGPPPGVQGVPGGGPAAFSHFHALRAPVPGRGHHRPL